MAQFPSRFRRLDAILADLPVEDPMLLTELDGYLTAVVVCPEEMSPALWMPPIWGGAFGEAAPFEDSIDQTMFAEMVTARFNEIDRDLGRGRPVPIYDVDSPTGEVIWEDWIGGFERATGLQAESWSDAAKSDDEQISAASAGMMTLADVAFDRSSLAGDEINAICDEAPSAIVAYLKVLYAGRARPIDPMLAAVKPGKVGRNEPCPCGSGNKFKRCCGANA